MLAPDGSVAMLNAEKNNTGVLNLNFKADQGADMTQRPPLHPLTADLSLDKAELVEAIHQGGMEWPPKIIVRRTTDQRSFYTDATPFGSLQSTIFIHHPGGLVLSDSLLTLTKVQATSRLSAADSCLSRFARYASHSGKEGRDPRRTEKLLRSARNATSGAGRYAMS